MANGFYNNERRGSYPKGGVGTDNANPERRELLARFRKEWITQGIDEEGVEFCRRAAEYLQQRKMTSSYVRNIFGELKRIESKGFAQSRTDFYLLRPKVAYATARAKDRGIEMNLFREIYECMAPHVSDDRTFKNLVNMVEAIIAFHKACGGRD